MKICGNCGRELNDDSKFCDGCGEKQIIPVQELTCNHCGKVVSEGTIFCDQCGSRIIIKEKQKEEDEKKLNRREANQGKKEKEKQKNESSTMRNTTKWSKSNPYNFAIGAIVLLWVSKIITDTYQMMVYGHFNNSIVCELIFIFTYDYAEFIPAIVYALTGLTIIISLLYAFLEYKRSAIKFSLKVALAILFMSFVTLGLSLILGMIQDVLLLPELALLSVLLIMIYWNVVMLSGALSKQNPLKLRALSFSAFIFYFLFMFVNFIDPELYANLFACFHFIGVILIVCTFVLKGKEAR